MTDEDRELIYANRRAAELADRVREAELASERRIISVPPNRKRSIAPQVALKKDYPMPSEQAHYKTPLTGLVISDAWVALLARAQVFAPVFKRGPRPALAWTRKPPTNGDKEVARRKRQMAAIFTVPC